MGNKTKKVIRKILGILGLMIITALLLSFVLVRFYIKEHSITGEERCKGISYWYTGVSFERDYERARDYYVLHYNASETMNWGFGGMDNVENLYKGKPFNCEDASHLFLCLADKYNIECHYYYWGRYKLRNKEFDGHLGIECRLRDKDGKYIWVILN